MNRAIHPTTLREGVTYRVVVCFEDETPAATNSTSTLWINPSSTGDTHVSSTTTRELDGNAINKIILRDSTGFELGEWTLDNIRVCKTFEEAVTPQFDAFDRNTTVFQWDSTSGVPYEIQCADSAFPTNWQPIGQVAATETTTAWAVLSDPSTNRSYRIVDPGLLLDEDFDYHPGKLESVSGGNWVLNGGNNQHLDVTGNAWHYTFVSDAGFTTLYERELTKRVPRGTTVYLSFDINAINEPPSDTGTAVLHLLSDVGATNNRCSIFLGDTGLAGEQYRIGIRNLSRSSITTNPATYHPTILVQGTTYHVVACFENRVFNEDTSTSKLWIDPTGEGDTNFVFEVNPPGTTNRLFGPFNKLVLRDRSNRNLGEWTIDNIRVRTTFEEIVAPQVISQTDQGIALQWDSIPGSTYEIQSTDDLTSNTWQTQAVVTATAGTISWGDLNNPSTSLVYRVVKQ